MANVIKEYQCNSCGLKFEVFQNHKQTTKKCKTCGKKVEQVISMPIISKAGGPRTIGTQIEQNNKNNPLTREMIFGPDAEKKIKAQERMKKIQKLSGDKLKDFIEKGTL
jgi:putative FmdB family regulatory protein